MAYHYCTDEQISLLEMVKEFADKEIRPNVSQWDEKGELPLDVVNAGLDMGLHCMDVPEEYGGSGLSAKTCCMIFEELSKADIGVSCAFSVTGTGVDPVMLFGSEEQKRLYADLVFRGRGLASFCLTEPGAGSDAGNVQTTAVKKGGEYVLNGTKCFITNAGFANAYFVIASTDKSKGNRGLSGFIVPKGTKGLSVGKEENKCGFRTSNTAEVILEDVVVPESYRVGREGDGFRIAMATLDHGRPKIGATALGLGQRALDEAVKYSKERVQFGKPISDNQGLQFMLADMEIKMEASRCLVYHVAELMDQGLPITMNGSIAKCFSTDSAMSVVTDAVQVLGGYGYMKEYPVEKLMRDAKVLQIVEGTNQIQRVVIAGHLLK
ncbi:acyl-CoA dehydrogenase family protein [Papillibacter cinnamivorans]|uniref:Acyl-CoA dehydrogenase n=1 Tax=Papillibacter cinnamivorans DSM 12816 TaxID=1122930 RepID=A0A1W2C417_9FIRM|nr:acyl-CoA dehydrogenase family protein [Papillibacter cinnamivorans]SMC79764.1 Acyl-CoA dehydrogenase [Papillibacter cinnamivorans DSM 12816]